MKRDKTGERGEMREEDNSPRITKEGETRDGIEAKEIHFFSLHDFFSSFVVRSRGWVRLKASMDLSASACECRAAETTVEC